MRLLASLRALADLGVRRALLDRAVDADVDATVTELDRIFAGAAAGCADARDAARTVASWVAADLVRRDGARVAELARAADERGSTLAAFVFGTGAEGRTFPRSARLPELCIPARAAFAPPLGRFARARCGLVAYPYARDVELTAHQDPVFVGRLLDHRWCRPIDAVRVAARRPTTAEIALTVATRDRWFAFPSVRAALAENPFTPRPLRAALLVLRESHGARARPMPQLVTTP